MGAARRSARKRRYSRGFWRLVADRAVADQPVFSMPTKAPRQWTLAAGIS